MLFVDQAMRQQDSLLLVRCPTAVESAVHKCNRLPMVCSNLVKRAHLFPNLCYDLKRCFFAMHPITFSF